MSRQYATVVIGPHLLYTGADGTPCFGIKVRSVKTRNECIREGYQYEWYINHHSISQTPIDRLMDDLGLTRAEVLDLKYKLNLAQASWKRELHRQHGQRVDPMWVGA